MNRHLSILTLIAFSLNAGLALAQDPEQADQDRQQAQQQQQDAEQARREVEQARKEAEQARKEAEQARKQAEQARRQAQKQAEQARREALRQAQDDARAQAQAQAAEARAQADEARARAQAQQARDAEAKARVQVVASGEGKVYTPGPFDRVVVDGSGQVRLVQGDRDEVFVPGDGRAQDDVDIRLSNGQMRIDLPGSWKFWNNGNGAQVEIRMRHLSKLTLSGSNDVLAAGPITGDHLSVSMTGSGVARFDQLQVANLSFDISGAGEGQLAGKVDQLHLSVSGKGKIGAEQLRAGGADVSISGVGNAVLWTVDSLRVQISGAGHVDYWGQPTVRKSISGFGSVDARGDKQ